MSESNIYEKLRKVQLELKVPKSQRNNFGNYNYRSAEDIVEAAKPVLDQHGLILVVTDSIELIGERYYVHAKAEVLTTSEEVSLQAHGYAREDESKKGMDGAQITGAASSYARKYALNGLFAIDDTKDADSDDHSASTRTAPPRAPRPSVGTANAKDDPATQTQKERIRAYLTAKGIGTSDMPLYLETEFGIMPGIMTTVDAENILKELA